MGLGFMEVLKFEAFPERTLTVLLYKDVTNSAELVQLLQAAKLDPELALLNATLVPGTFPLVAAAHKGLLAAARGGLKTRTLHSELVYNYAASKHITESLRRCGIDDKTAYILAARFDCSPAEVADIDRLVKGTRLAVSELPGRVDLDGIKKHYKIGLAELEMSSLEDAIACRIAARDSL